MEKLKPKNVGDTKSQQFKIEHLSLIKSWVEEKNDLLLLELCVGVARRRHRLAESTGIRISISTMHRAVEKLNLRCKKKVSMQVSKILHEYRNYAMNIVGG
jgi:putative transposase